MSNSPMLVDGRIILQWLSLDFIYLGHHKALELMLPVQKFLIMPKSFKRTFLRAAMDLGENVEVSVNIEERVERRAWVTFSKIHCCLEGKWDICLCFCKSFYFCGFLPAAQLVVDSVVGPGHYITKLTLVKFLWPIQFWWYLFFSRWLSDRYTPGSPQLSSWLVRASCTEVLQRPALSSFLVF